MKYENYIFLKPKMRIDGKLRKCDKHGVLEYHMELIPTDLENMNAPTIASVQKPMAKLHLAPLTKADVKVLVNKENLDLGEANAL